MHALSLRSKWGWAWAGLLGSIGSFFVVPFNLAGCGPIETWFLWLVVPFGMWLRPCRLVVPLEFLVWLGPPAIYGVILSLASGTKWWRFALCSVLVVHTTGVVCAAL